MNFRVWAPRAERVDLLLGAERIPMMPLARGHFEANAESRAGDRYAFSLDGGPERPDPRSPHQPDGVHARSAVVDHGSYAWRNPGFRPPPLSSAVIYELHVGTFTNEGTLDAAIERLPYLRDLGVTHIGLMPLNAFEGDRGWGYDGVLWFSPHAAYTGPDGPDAVKRFVDACHEFGLAAVVDVVYNHLGPSGNYLGEFAPWQNEIYQTPWGSAVNLDERGSDFVRRLIIDNALMWLDVYRFDALRIDAVHSFFDRSALHLLEQLRREVDQMCAATGRRCDLIAESDLHDPRVVTATDANGLGMDAQWSDDFHHSLHALMTGERAGYYGDFGAVADLAKAWNHAFVYDGKYATDRDRTHGRPATGLGSDRFLAYAQTHDQVGNRAVGDRLSHLLGPDQLEVAAALVLLSPFVPMLFQGEEWGATAPFQYFTSHQDPDLGRAVREGRQREFGRFVAEGQEVPDPQDRSTFERSRLDSAEIDREPHRRLLDWHRGLIALRRSYPDFAPGRLGEHPVVSSERPRWLAAARGRFVLAASFEPEPLEIPIDQIRFLLGASKAPAGTNPITDPADLHIVMTNHGGAALSTSGITLPEHTALVLGPASATP